MGGIGYPQRSPVRVGRLSYLHKGLPYFHGDRLGWSFSGGTRVHDAHVCPDRPPRWDVLCRRQPFCVSPLCFPAPRRCGWRFPPAPRRCLRKKDRMEPGIPVPRAPRCRVPAEKECGMHRAAKSVKQSVRSTAPNLCAGFHHTVHRLQDVPASGRGWSDKVAKLTAVPCGTRPLVPTKEWLPPTFTALLFVQNRV